MSARQRFQNVLVSSPQELKSIPGYSPEIDLTQDKFVEILSHYTFRDEYQCALTGCHTWHKEGYVCVFESGAIGNVGRVCARNWIGSSFDEVLHRYQREIARPELLSKLAIAKADVPARLRQCDELRQAALDFITFKNSLRCAFPVVWRVLNAPQNGIAYQVMHSKTVTEIEEQEDGSIRSRSKIVSEKLGTIRGIRALRENGMELINSINRDLASIANSGGPQELTWGGT